MTAIGVRSSPQVVERATTTCGPLAAYLPSDVERDPTPTASTSLAVQFAALENIELADSGHSVRHVQGVRPRTRCHRAGTRSRNREREPGRPSLIHTMPRLGQRCENVKRFVHLDKWHYCPRRS